MNCCLNNNPLSLSNPIKMRQNPKFGEKMTTFLAILALLANLPFSLQTGNVICYYASWAVTRSGNGKFTPKNIDPTLCTHVNYAFLGLYPNGSLQVLDPVNDLQKNGFKQVSDLKKINRNLKVLFSVGGAAASTGTFAEVAADPEKRQVLVKSALEFFQTYNFDGLDVDWEYPWGGNRQQFNELLATLKNAFKPQGYLLTVAVNSIPGEVAGYDIPAMAKYLDIINVMTYDFHAIWGGQTAQNSPLYGGKHESDWQRENRNANASITQWIEGGADPQQLTIGIAFYGHSFTLVNPENHGLGAPTTGPAPPGKYTNNLGSLGYNEICEFHRKGTVVFQDDMKVPYLYDGKLWVGFDNEKSVALKTRYALEKNLAGVMIWSIETDDLHGFCGEPNGLLKAINKEINNHIFAYNNIE